MSRPTSRRHALGPVVVAAAAAAALAWPGGLAAAGPAAVSPATRLTDLGGASANGLAGARAGLTLAGHQGHAGAGATAVLRVSGIDRGQAGRTFGAHLHTGPCVANDGAAAGPHYNHDAATGRVPVVVDRTTEVWLDLTVSPGGSATTVTHVPFVPSGGQRSVVLHALPTDAAGLAGARLVCLPVTW